MTFNDSFETILNPLWFIWHKQTRNLGSSTEKPDTHYVLEAYQKEDRWTPGVTLFYKDEKVRDEDHKRISKAFADNPGRMQTEYEDPR